MNIHLTYLGTGCIFKYDKNHPFGQEINGFTEESDPNFLWIKVILLLKGLQIK